MQEEFSKIPATTFQQIGINAGMVLNTFDPATGTFDRANIIGATTGGIQFNAAPEYTDFGEDIDNCPKNTKELKRLDDWTITVSGTFVTVDGALAKKLAAAADLASNKITPRSVLDVANDFNDIWIVGDYSNINKTDATAGKTAGFIAIHVMNALSTGGFQLQSTDKGKMQFSFEFTAHYSIDADDTVPFEIYVKGGVKTNP